MKPTLYTCYDTGRIFEQRYRYPATFSVVRKYELIYAENLPRFSCSRQIYALPFGEKPLKVYLGTDRDGASEYSRGIRKNLTERERALLKRMHEQDGGFCFILRSEAEAELFRGMLEAEDEYELIHVRSAGSDEPYPEGYELLGYDVSYAVDCGGAFSIICDCMFICRWHGCDDEGTLFQEDFDRLNDNGLFDSFDDAHAYMVKYLNEDWSERGKYSIFEVRGRKPQADGAVFGK
ncbi:MAG: hypothetical protein IKZ82_14000 [Clostridia bacterium]|nr:hypothetical protein [Clostridia bacterium]